jgi:hypothetical protein
MLVVMRPAKPSHIERARVVIVMRVCLVGAALLTRLANEAPGPDLDLDGTARSFVDRVTLLRSPPVPHVVGRHASEPARIVRSSELACGSSVLGYAAAGAESVL